jgi:hypothetical protein
LKNLKSKIENLSLMVEQILSSAFNFFMVVIISKTQPEHVSDYGLVLSFSLVILGYLRNSVITPYILSGSGGFKVIFFSLISSCKQLYFLITVLFCFAYCLYSEVEFEFVSVFIFFCLLEILKTFHIVSYKSSVFLILVSPIYIFSAICAWYFGYAQAFLLSGIFLIIVAGIYSITDSSTLKSIDIASSRNSFVLSSAFSIYTHGPLWFLYLFRPEFSGLYVQVRSFFQPVHVFSRAADLIEKRNAVVAGADLFGRVRSLIKTYFFFGSTVLAILTLAAAYLFPMLYGVDITSELSFALIIFSLISLCIMTSKPIETVYFKLGAVNEMSINRLISTALFITLIVSFGTYEFLGFTQFITVLLISFISWLFMLITSYFGLRRLSV